jgi:hypothetical protein
MQENLPTGESSESSSKFALPIAVAIATAIAGGVGTTLYQHELMILSNARHIERLKIKDYRQHKEILRNRIDFLADAKNTLEAVLEIDPDVFGPNSSLVLKARRAQLDTAKRKLENYVEENKHGGRDD